MAQFQNTLDLLFQLMALGSGLAFLCRFFLWVYLRTLHDKAHRLGSATKDFVLVAQDRLSAVTQDGWIFSRAPGASRRAERRQSLRKTKSASEGLHIDSDRDSPASSLAEITPCANLTGACTATAAPWRRRASASPSYGAHLSPLATFIDVARCRGSGGRHDFQMLEESGTESDASEGAAVIDSAQLSAILDRHRPFTRARSSSLVLRGAVGARGARGTPPSLRKVRAMPQ